MFGIQSNHYNFSGRQKIRECCTQETMMLDKNARYFTDREYGERPRTTDVIDGRLWSGFYILIDTRIGDSSFGYRFPYQCPDGRGPCGCDSHAFGCVLSAEVPGTEWPLSHAETPETPMLLDVLEFCASAVGDPIQGSYHSFFDHHHLNWDRQSGLARFVADVNLLFARNGIAYELTDEGQARRVLPQPLGEALRRTLFTTGDTETDRLLEVARDRIFMPKADERQDALEKLWDAFERLKTLEPGSDKRAQAEALLDRAAVRGSKFRNVLGEEAAALTKIGNSFRIRHSETTQENLSSLEQVDYLFGRLFSFIRMILKATGRGG